MPVLFDQNPDTGVTTYFDYDPIKDQAFLTYEQDVSGFLDHTNALRKNEDYSKRGIKEEWWHYASIPTVVELELRNKGLKLENPDHMPRILKEINSNYPYIKSTDKWHS